ncbi:bifunctional cobalt-precorrin-7 (C(5))-methyltransferase/cobalt-precorrin-6B (C(15))-methyltransferase, partial [Corynebacterium matruchotii]
GETLWDIGGGAGSVAIECLRATNTGKAVCFEADEIRRGRILKNARKLGVAHRLAVQGAAPDNYTSVPDNPDVIFIGGGLTMLGVFADAWNRLKVGGRMVINAVTIESEQQLWQLKQRYGGELVRLSVAKEHRIGSFAAFQPALPVTQWVATKQPTVT